MSLPDSTFQSLHRMTPLVSMAVGVGSMQIDVMEGTYAVDKRAFADRFENEEPTWSKTAQFAYGFICAFVRIKAGTSLSQNYILSIMPLLEETPEDKSKATDPTYLNPRIKQEFRKYVKPKKKRDFNIVKFVYDNNQIIGIYFHKNRIQGIAEHKTNIVAIGLCHYTKSIPCEYNIPFARFTNYELFQVKVPQYLFPQKDYEQSFNDFVARIAPAPKDAPATRVKKMFFGQSGKAPWEKKSES